MRILTFRILLFAAVCAICRAQTAEITGRVEDATGAAIPAASISIANVETGVKLNLRSNETGYYTAPLLPPGTYEMTVEAQGFRGITRKGIRLEVEQAARLDFTMQVGEVTERVQVTAEAPLVATEESSLGTVVDRRKIMELPLNGRNPLGLMTLAPGVLPNPRGANGANINGGRDSTGDILLDGAPATKTDQGDSLTAPLLEGVEEFKVHTGSYNAEFGRSGGIVNVVTKGGTNEWHGALFEFARNDAFDANNFFFNARGQGKEKLRYHQFGGAIGGPIRIPKVFDGRNRTFFYFTPQFTRRRGAGLRISTIPTAEERSGDFRRSGANGAAVPVFDPATTRAQGTTFTRDVFPGSVLPASRFHPVALKMLEFGYPLPNQQGAANNFVAGGPASTENNSYMGRIDHNFTAQNRISFRYLYTNNSSLKPESWPGLPAQGGSAAANNRGPDTARRDNAVLRDTIALRPNLLNEFTYSLMYSESTLNPASKNGGWAQKLGIKNAAPYLFPNVSIAGYTGLFGGNLSVEGDVDHQFADTVTWIKGSHQVKAGFEMRPQYFRNQQPGAATAGTFTFNTLPTRNPSLSGAAAGGHAMASLLLGIPSSSSININDQKWGGFWRYYSGFVQDQWKLSPRVTLNLGVRWELNRPRIERWNRQSVFDLSTLALRFAGEGGASRTLFEPDYTNFAPRIGIAWSPGGSRTSIRAGFGMYYLPISIIGSATEFTRGFTASQNFQTLDGGITYPLTLSETFPAIRLSREVGALDTVSTIGPQYTNPYTTQWTLSLQREVFARTLVEATYIGTRGTHLQVADHNLNQVPAALLGPGNAQLRRPYPTRGNISYPYEPIANSIFHGLQLKMERRLGGGLNLLAWYSLQKSIDDASGMKDIRTVGTVVIQDHHNLAAERAISGFDRTHNFALTGLYELPFGKGKRYAASGLGSAVAGGWQMNGILTVRSGVPLAFTMAQNITGSLGGGSRPNKRRSAAISSPAIDRWFDTAAFAAPAQFQFGNASRNEPDLRGPGAAQIDFSLFRNFRIGERYLLQLRGEAFNATNRVSFGNPATSVGAAGLGIITSADDARSIQLGLRFSF